MDKEHYTLTDRYAELVKRAAVYNCMSILHKREDQYVMLDGEQVSYSFRDERRRIMDNRFNLEKICDWELRKALETNAEVQLAEFILLNLHKADLIDQFKKLYE
jgi:hypothetical protein